MKNRKSKNLKLADKNSISKHEIPFGASGTDVVGRVHNQDDQIELLKGYQAAEFYDKMRRSDAQIKKVLGAINNPIRSAEWNIQAANEDPKSIEAAQLIEKILFEDINWSKFLNEALTFVPHGYSMFEVVHQNKNDIELGDYTSLAQLGFRRQATITEWIHNDITGKLIEVRQESNSDIRVNTMIPAENLLMFYSEQEGDNIGFPLCRILYGPYKRKLIALELMYIGIERFAIPTPILEVPKNISQSDQEYIAAVNVLQNFTSAEDSFITYPTGWNLQLHNNVFDPDKLKQVIKAEDEAMSGAILANFLELGLGGNGGAYALSNDLSDFFLSGIEYYANIVRNTINRELIPSLIKLNFGDSFNRVDLPKISYSGISDKAGLELMQVITGFSSAGLITKDEPLEDHIRRIYHLPPKIEGEMVSNGETEDSIQDDSENSTEDDSNFESENQETMNLSLSEFGHYHKFQGKVIGPAIQRGEKHFHDILDEQGNPIAQTKAEKDTPTHTHEVEENKFTGVPIQVSIEVKKKDNPETLMSKYEFIIANIVRMNQTKIAEKYIVDILNKYKTLPDNKKLNATKDIKISGLSKFEKELKGSFTGLSKDADNQVRAEVPSKSDVKLSEDLKAIKKEFSNFDNFKFNDFSKLPKRIQILIASQAKLIASKNGQGITDTIAFTFTSSEPSTNDIEVLRADMQEAAKKKIQSGNAELVAANISSQLVNETRNTFLLDKEVSKDIASYTFLNSDPKTEICKTLVNTTYEVNSADLVRYQPPLHHNCKSYLRANLKVSKNKPEITGLPPISAAAQKSITLNEVTKCHC